MARKLISWRISRRLTFWIVSLGIIGVFAALALPNLVNRCTSTRAGEMASGLHSISLALERYATDNGGYFPWSMTELAEQGYMPRFPSNALIVDGEKNHQYMQCLEPGRPGTPGDFCYLKLVGTIDGVERVIGYELYLYGRPMDIKDYPELKNIPRGIDAESVYYAIRSSDDPEQ